MSVRFDFFSVFFQTAPSAFLEDSMYVWEHKEKDIPLTEKYLEVSINPNTFQTEYIIKNCAVAILTYIPNQ